jgi:hypothetical protein
LVLNGAQLDYHAPDGSSVVLSTAAVHFVLS